MKDNLEFLDSLRHLQVSSFLLCLEQVSLFLWFLIFLFLKMINLRMYLVIYYNRDKIQNYIYYHAFINNCNINIFTFCKVDNLCKNNPTGFFGWLIICLKLCIYIFLPCLPMWSDSMSLRPIISLLEAFWIPSPKTWH